MLKFSSLFGIQFQHLTTHNNRLKVSHFNECFSFYTDLKHYFYLFIYFKANVYQKIFLGNVWRSLIKKKKRAAASLLKAHNEYPDSCPLGSLHVLGLFCPVFHPNNTDVKYSATDSASVITNVLELMVWFGLNQNGKIISSPGSHFQTFWSNRRRVSFRSAKQRLWTYLLWAYVLRACPLIIETHFKVCSTTVTIIALTLWSN